jgi:protein-S-isoprenylcysteine O-methyltransferase Ste14
MAIPAFTFYAMLAGWFGFAGAMVGATRHPGQVERRRERSSVTGLVFQMLAYSAVWSVRRGWTAPLLVQTVAPQALLREQFGAVFDAYAARVPALIPFI